MKTFTDFKTELIENQMVTEKRTTLSVSFDSSSDANKFKKELTSLGLAKNISMSKKSGRIKLKVSADNEENLEIITALIKDARAEYTTEDVINQMMSSIRTGKLTEFVNLNDQSVEIDPEDANLIMQTHDNLNEDNQEILREMIIFNEDSLKSIKQFCRSLRN